MKKVAIGVLLIALVLGLTSMVAMGKTKITYLWGTETAVVHEAVETAFEEAFPEIDLEIIAKPPAGRWQLLQTWAAAGQLPDVFSCPTGANLVKWVDAKSLMPLNDHIAELGIDTSEYPDWAYRKVSGEIYGLPFAINFYGYLCYDKEAFDEAGVPYPTNDMTWDDLAETMRLMTVRDDEGKTIRFGSLTYYPRLTIASLFGGRVVDNPSNPTKMLFGEAPFLEGMQWYRDRVDEGTLMGRREFIDEDVNPAKAFSEGRYASVITDMGWGGNFTNAGIDWDVVTVPHNKPNYGYPYSAGAIAVGYTTEHPLEALTFVNWFTSSPAAVKIWYGQYLPDNGNPPITTRAMEAFAEIAGDRGPDGWRCIEVAIAAGVDMLPLWDGGAEIMGAYTDAVLAVSMEEKPVESLIEAAAECQKMLDESRSE